MWLSALGDRHGPGVDGPQHRKPRPAGGEPERVATPAPRSRPLCCSPPRFAFGLVARQGANGITDRMHPAIAQRGTKSVGPRVSNLLIIGSPNRARTWNLRINSPGGHPSESRARQRSRPKRPVIFSAGLQCFPLGRIYSASQFYRTRHARVVPEGDAALLSLEVESTLVMVPLFPCNCWWHRHP
jgi:hypothetical protein